ncbi:hypothetical protein [Nonomuraea typhae]|uniref:Uncharacterized protein n=1 Tax=Nonomuraea typhae TaxID=2603600 RepID=A0ABW7ZDE0_9ACTN
MRTWRNLSKLATAAVLVTVLALSGSSAASAEESRALTCGSQVWLDGIRALAISENGRDEVYMLDGNGNKIWPAGAAYVSMAVNQRVEVDKCVPANAFLALWEEDTAGFDDSLGGVSLIGDVTRDYTFIGGGGSYRLGVIA